MSFLAPLYLLGALAISLPVLLHLIRRTPRGRQPFSSLMFLAPSPPRITRRSRIEHWLLLLLRAAALALLACAFARPFLRETANLLLDNGPGRRLAIVVDTSASMRRGDLWRQANAKVERALSTLGPGDQVGLFAFDETVRLIVDWDEPLPDLSARRARIKKGLMELGPTWSRTDLGKALVTVADRLATAAGELKDGRSGQIVLVTDLQHGSDTSVLQASEWPAEVRLQIEQVQAGSADNAAARILTDEAQAGWRVLVTNAAGAETEQFRVEWVGAGLPADPNAIVTLYVPAGQSRVTRLPAPPPGADRVRITGDAHPFDNDFFFAPLVQRDLRVVYAGEEKPDDPQGLRYFLDRVWSDKPHRKVRIEAGTLDSLWGGSQAGQPALVVVSAAQTPVQLETLGKYVRGGGTALLVVSDARSAASLVDFARGVTLLEAPPNDVNPTAYAMLGEIDFEHPVFASFASPRYNDFTKVRIWKHQRFALDQAADAQVLARFDNGDPALWEQPLGSGKLMCLACGWRPADSQLALSSKFVPLLSGVLDHLTGHEGAAAKWWRVRQGIQLPPSAEKLAVAVTKPNGSVSRIESDAEPFRDTDQPGVYRFRRGATTMDFAVNLDSTESDTAPLAADHLEQLGVRVGRHATAEEQLERQRQMHDVELESRQKLWRLLLLGVLGMLAVETTLASRLAQRAERTEANS